MLLANPASLRLQPHEVLPGDEVQGRPSRGPARPVMARETPGHFFRFRLGRVLLSALPGSFKLIPFFFPLEVASPLVSHVWIRLPHLEPTRT